MLRDMRSYLTCSFDTKAESSSENIAAFSGIASTSETDLHGDIIEAGAFEPIRKKMLPSGKTVPDVLMLRDHDRTQVIGGWTKFEQYGTELHVEGELCLDVRMARETYALLKRGFLSGLSVGFAPAPDGVKFDQRANKRFIKKADLRECSIVSMPANESARVTNVKTLDRWLAGRGFDAEAIDVLKYEGLEALIALKAAGDKPYGDVRYADPGYQEDGRKRYPVDTEGRIRAAWNYIHQARNRAFYTREQLSRIEARIIAAWKRVIDKDGPPAYQEDAAPKLPSEKTLTLNNSSIVPANAAAAAEIAKHMLSALNARGKGDAS